MFKLKTMLIHSVTVFLLFFFGISGLSVDWAPIRQHKTTMGNGPIEDVAENDTLLAHRLVHMKHPNGPERHKGFDVYRTNGETYKYVDFNEIKKFYKERIHDLEKGKEPIMKINENNRLFFEDSDGIKEDPSLENKPIKWLNVNQNFFRKNYTNRFNVIKFTKKGENELSSDDETDKEYENEENHSPDFPEQEIGMNYNIDDNSFIQGNDSAPKPTLLSTPTELDDAIDLRPEKDLENSESFGFKFINGTLWKFKRLKRRRPNNLEILQFSDNHAQSPRLPAKQEEEGSGPIHNAVKQKLAKFLNLFTVIKFSNEPCLTSDGVHGTCYHHLECRSLGGLSGGPCAQGYGVCCYTHNTCGDRTSQNSSFFLSPASENFPKECTLLLDRASPGVVQIRLDFTMFELKGPTNGTCIDDQLIISGQNRNSIVPVICGINTGNHVYLDVDKSTEPIKLTVITMGNAPGRKFMIKITQLHLGDALNAPKNCLQYYIGTKDTFESFNYQNMPGTLITNNGYFNNLNYAICIRKEDNYCTITYNNAGTFQIINIDEDGVSLISPRQAGVETFNCPDDYLIINGLRLCGERLNDASAEVDFTKDAPVTDNTNGPFIVNFRTNGNTNGRGYRISYNQNPC